MAENQEQQRDADVIAYSSFTGVRNDVTPERFAISDLDIAVNCDLDKTGRLARRAGYTRHITGAIHSLWANGSICLYVTGGNLVRMQPDYSTLTVRSGLTPGLKMSYDTLAGRIFYSNGTETGVLDAGVSRSWGINPPLPFMATPTVGGMPGGRYQYTMTFSRADGQESGAGLAGTIQLPTNSGLTFTLPISTDPGVTGKTIYLTPPNGDVLFVAAMVLNSTTTLTYANDTKELVVPLETQFLQLAPAGQLVKAYRGRMFVAAGDTLYPSEPFAYEQFDIRNYIQLDSRITMLATIEDRDAGAANSGFFVGTDRSCGVLIGSSPDEFQYVPKTDYGAVLGALDYVDGALYGDGSTGARQLPMFVTTSGICVGMPNMEISNLTRTKYEFTAAGVGAAIFEPGPNRFIAVTNY